MAFAQASPPNGALIMRAGVHANSVEAGPPATSHVWWKTGAQGPTKAGTETAAITAVTAQNAIIANRLSGVPREINKFDSPAFAEPTQKCSGPNSLVSDPPHRRMPNNGAHLHWRRLGIGALRLRSQPDVKIDRL